MFSLIVIGLSLVFVISAFTEEEQQMMKALHAECVSQTGCPEDLISKASSGNFAEDDKLKCYMKCLYNELGVIDDDGKIDVSGLMTIFPKDIHAIAEPIITKCGTVDGSDLCDSIYQTNKCYYATNPEVYFLP